jgi:quercetin dioxygenase-like cupin family protein
MNTIKERFIHRSSRGFNIFFGKKIIGRLVLTFISFILLNLSAKAQKTMDTAVTINSIFPRGEKVVSSNNFNGTVWLNRFICPGDSLDCIVALVTFQPGVRTNWHIHPGGQILIVTQGTGYCQEKGKSRQVIRKGDIIKCSPGVQHWQGASPRSEFAHLVVAPDIEKGEVTGLQTVTDEEYKGLK